MAAIVLDGAAAARDVYGGLKERMAALARANVRPGLAAVLVGDNPASKIYIRNKVKACAEAGVHSEVHALPQQTSPDELAARLGRLNADPGVHGILVQLPLPPHLDETLVATTVAAHKDVDGLTWQNLGALMSGHPRLEPCTPRGVVKLIERAGMTIEGRQAVVVGRSTIVGKPMAMMLTARSATVTVCHSRTAELITPGPGGVGPMTIAMVIENTVTAAERITGQQTT